MAHPIYKEPFVTGEVHNASSPSIEDQFSRRSQSLLLGVLASPLYANNFFNQPTWHATVTTKSGPTIRWDLFPQLPIVPPAEAFGRDRPTAAWDGANLADRNNCGEHS